MSSQLSNLPAPVAEAFCAGTPMQQLLGSVLDELGGIDFLVDWAEENPDAFMRLVMAANPAPVHTQSAPGAGSLHIHMPPTLGPGPLDAGQIVAEG